MEVWRENCLLIMGKADWLLVVWRWTRAEGVGWQAVLQQHT